MAKKPIKNARRHAYKASGEGIKAAKRQAKAAFALLLLCILLLVIFAFWYKSSPETLKDFLSVFLPQNTPDSSKDPSIAPAKGELVIHFVDVGQGDGIVLQLPGGETMIIDAGPGKSSNLILDYIDGLGITTFDYLVLTHSDEDHVGKMDDVLNKYEVKKVYRPNVAEDIIDTKAYSAFLEAVKNEQGVIDCFSDYNADFGSVENGWHFDFITPTLEQYSSVKSSSSESKNAISPIMQLSYGGRKILFTGDANETSEEWFADAVQIGGMQKSYYDVDVLKVGHHGSSGFTTAAFLDVVRPEYAVISYGVDNKYGHPHTEALVRLNAIGVSESEIYGTGEYGTVVLKLSDTDGDGMYEMTFTSVKTGNVLNTADSATSAFFAVKQFLSLITSV